MPTSALTVNVATPDPETSVCEFEQLLLVVAKEGEAE